MTFSDKLHELHQSSIDKQKEFVEVVSEIRKSHPMVPDEKYHLRDKLYKEFVKYLEEFKRLAKHCETKGIPISTEYTGE